MESITIVNGKRIFTPKQSVYAGQELKLHDMLQSEIERLINKAIEGDTSLHYSLSDIFTIEQLEQILEQNPIFKNFSISFRWDVFNAIENHYNRG